MTNLNDPESKDLEQILKRLDDLEQRIELLESNKEQIQRTQTASGLITIDQETEPSDLTIPTGSPFETRLGEYGLAWLGNIVLFFAITFLWQYLNDTGKPLFAMMAGMLSVAAVFTMSHYFRKNYSYLSFLFNLFGFIMLFYILLRLHYYNDKPIIENQLVATVILLAATGAQLYFAIKKQSQILAGLAFTFALFTGLTSNHATTFFLVSIATTGMVLYCFLKFNWWQTLLFILSVSFIINVAWLFKIPNPGDKTADNLIYRYTFIYYSLITALYSLVALIKQREAWPKDLILSVILLAGSSYTFLLFTLVLKYFPHSYVPLFTAISIYCIAWSVLLKFYSHWKFAPALYALYGFIAISITIYGTYHFPDSFLLLICQSFLVLTLALWYRSQIITLMNTFLLLILVIMYYNISGELQAVNFSIPVVAFLSARIINWQKERLNIKTDFIRNLYLFILFFSLLYATYKGLPGQYITVSWLCISGIYVGLSILLKNIKYRWMALANLLVAACYLFLVDLAEIELIYRIMIFLFFAITTLVISIYYVNKIKKKN